MKHVSLSPIYGSDIRRLVNRAFAPAEPVAVAPLPGGTFAARVQAQHNKPTLLVAPEGTQPVAAGVLCLPAHRYWPRALAQRMLVHGPLLALASSDLSERALRQTERLLLRVHRTRYHSVPLPLEVLAQLRERAADRSGRRFMMWLEAARVTLMTAKSLEHGVDIRASLRRHALISGARNDWPEPTVAVAELMSDILLLCHACELDLQAAEKTAGQHTSVAKKLEAAGESQTLLMEAALPHLIRPCLDEMTFNPDERADVVRFAGSRRRSTPTLLSWPDAVPSPAPRAPWASTRNQQGPTTAQVAPGKEPLIPDDARLQYRRVVESLESRVVGAHMRDVIRRLALIGVGHVHGLTRQRVLLVGSTGAGKSHVARALAQSLDEQPHLAVDVSDITGTGWVGAEISAILESLADLTRGRDAGGVLLLDEVDKARVDYTATGNSREAKVTLMSSLLGLLSGERVATNSGHDQIDTSRILVIGTGAFEGRFASTPPSTEDLVRWGWLQEFAARWGERICVPPPGRDEAIELLRRSDRSVEVSLGPLAAALGFRFIVPLEVVRYAADIWLRGGADFRTASEWLLTAARRRLIEALESDHQPTIVLAPDDLDVPATFGGESRGEEDGHLTG